MTSKRLKIIVILLLALIPFPAHAQKFDGKLAADLSSGYVMPYHKFLTGKNSAQKPIDHTVAAHLKYGFQLSPETELGRKYPNTFQGIGLSYHSFFNDKELGAPIVISVFQHSRIATITPKLSFDYEWNFGAACNWVPFDEVKNPYNRLMGSSVTAYINVGFMLNWNFAPSWNWTAGLDITHISNGNSAYPNFGLNTTGLRTGMIYSFNQEPAATAARPKEEFRRHVTYDLILYGSWRAKTVKIGIVKCPLDKNFAIAGLNFNPLYNVCKYFRTGLSLDVLYDQSLNIQSHLTNADKENPQYEKPPFREQLSVGLSARAELVMPIFSINAGVGNNILAFGEDRNTWYEVIALKTSLSKKLFLHVGCIFYNIRESRCLMLGMGYRL